MRLIDADALKKDAQDTREFQIDLGGVWDVKCLIDDAPTIDAIPVVRCKDCKNRGTPYSCPMRKLVMPFQGAGSYDDCTEDDGYCHMGVKKDGGAGDV
jgi:hypothetical protein